MKVMLVQPNLDRETIHKDNLILEVLKRTPAEVVILIKNKVA